MIADTVEVYRRILKAVKRGTGLRLTWDELAAIMRDGAVEQAIRADDEQKETRE